MKDWKSYLFWVALPLLLLLLVFGFMSAVNWGYEGKLLTLDASASDWTSVHLGPILLVMAMGMALIAGLILFAAWVFWPQSHVNWFLVPLTLVTILLIFPGLFMIMLGPAAITMMEQEQTRSVSK
ncbi:MAG TPA: hypothetical protein VL981_02690 [Candidatus Methylacidiphilales bacterium]|nr:hypothetical protein [Candidatus Methylacidiphilales bacterium]